MSDDLANQGRSVGRDLNNGFPVTVERCHIIEQMADRIEELEIENRQLRGLLCRLVFCEDAEFYPSAIESDSPYCIDFEQWHEDAIKLLTGGKDD